jgi:hypothetical protein
MNKPFACLALAFIAPIFGSLYAQEGPPPEQYEPPPPVGLDVDYLAPPKQKLSIGFRVLTGPRVSFSGSGIIPSGANLTPDANGIRRYNDGFVDPDTRTNAATGAAVAPDGRTNTWNYNSAAQVGADGTSVNMNAYSAKIDGNNPHHGRAGSGNGIELTYERDFGWHLGRVQFDLIGGIGLNKISYSRSQHVLADVTTLTDNYQTFGPNLDVNNDPVLDSNGNPTNSATPTAPPSPAPYTAPSTGLDANGTSVNNTTLLGSTPTNPTPASSTTTNATQVTEKWNVNGAYFTLRGGAEMIVPITEKFSATVSGGPALVYVGTTFSVDQTLTTPTSTPITSTVSDNFNTVLPAYFADANIEYSFNDVTGVYLGAVFQSTTGYNQDIHSPNGNYTNRLDFGNQEGMRGGISFKF